MSVDTNTKHKNLAPYRRLNHDGYKILITPHLVGLAQAMRIDATSGFRKKLVVEFDDGSGGACAI